MALFLSPVLLYRMLIQGKYRSGWSQRRGILPDMPRSSPMWPRIWIHAVSVGEVNAVRGLIETWRKESPEVSIVLSTTTDTGFARATSLFPDLTVIRYPLDLSRWVRRALNRIDPTLVVLVELEVWYQFVTHAAERKIPVVVINGRLSESSLKWFQRLRGISRRMFGSLRWVGAQNAEYVERFQQVGVPPERVEATGSLKWDTAEITDTLPGIEELAEAMGISRKRSLLVCGSTGPGEEKVILDAYKKLHARHPRLQLAIIPRKPERFDEVAELIKQYGYDCVRRSESPDGTRREPGLKSIALGDTMGELRKFYLLADMVFVGRTMADMGGSDMMEVAALAKPILIGPHTDNFKETVDKLTVHKAVLVLKKDLDDPEAAAETLFKTINQIVDYPDYLKKLGQSARAVVQANRGATRRTLNRLQKLA
jgi:3-deoxy-D-manno-octulosonic-acid transferase